MTTWDEAKLARDGNLDPLSNSDIAVIKRQEELARLIPEIEDEIEDLRLHLKMCKRELRGIESKLHVAP